MHSYNYFTLFHFFLRGIATTFDHLRPGIYTHCFRSFFDQESIPIAFGLPTRNIHPLISIILRSGIYTHCFRFLNQEFIPISFDHLCNPAFKPLRFFRRRPHDLFSFQNFHDKAFLLLPKSLI